MLAYRDWSDEATLFGFLRDQDPLYAAYRYLARAPGVDAVWQVDRGYSSTPGYYYLHRAIPLYDAYVGRGVGQDLATLNASVSHVVAAVADLVVPGYSLEREFGNVRVLRRDAAEPPVRQVAGTRPGHRLRPGVEDHAADRRRLPRPARERRDPFHRPTVGERSNAVAVGAKCALRGYSGSSRRRPQRHARRSAGWDGHAVGIEGQPGVGSLLVPRLASAAPDHGQKRAATATHRPCRCRSSRAVDRSRVLIRNAGQQSMPVPRFSSSSMSRGDRPVDTVRQRPLLYLRI